MDFLEYIFGPTSAPVQVGNPQIFLPTNNLTSNMMHNVYDHEHSIQQKTENIVHDHSAHQKVKETEEQPPHIRKYNHTFLDHWDEMPPELQDFINEHYNGKFVMDSIQPETEHDWNVNNTGNSTSEFSDMPRWKKIIDKVVTYVMMFNVVGLMLGMGCAIYWRQIVGNLWPPIGILIGMCGQFLLLPATGFAFSILFKLKPYEALGCLVVSCSPGGSFSNFFTFWVEGDLALSIVMTACSSIIAFVGMPFNLWLYSSYYVGEQESQSIVIPYLSILRALSFICGPVIVGMIIRSFHEKIAQGITRITSVVGYLGFLIVLTSWAILYWPVFLVATPLIYAGAVILPVTGFCSAYLVAFILRRSHKVCRTIGIETGSQNMPVALSIILLSFDDPEVRAKMLLFPTLYGVFMLCEVFMGIGVYRTGKMCLNHKKKSRQYPVVHHAMLANGTATEKERLQV